MSDLTTISLHFANEKDYVVNKIITEIKDIGRTCFLEFSDQKPLDYYESFSLPFYIYYYPQILQLNWRYIKNFKGIIVDNNHLSSSSQLMLNLSKLNKINKIHTVYLSSSVDSILSLDNFNSLELFPQHEVSYRVPDYSKIKNSISNLLKYNTP